MVGLRVVVIGVWVVVVMLHLVMVEGEAGGGVVVVVVEGEAGGGVVVVVSALGVVVTVTDGVVLCWWLLRK